MDNGILSIVDSSILERVFGNNKERDLIILQLLARGETEEDIACITKESPLFEDGLSQQRISQIALNNPELLDEITLKQELARTSGRLRRLFKLCKHRTASKKDIVDIIEQIRKEIGETSKLKVEFEDVTDATTKQDMRETVRRRMAELLPGSVQE